MNASPQTRPIGLVTSSYRGDFDRCHLLCESIDRWVTGHNCHYLLVEHADVAMFKVFEGPKRRVVDERDLLPFWLRPFPDPLSFGRRRIWLSPKGPPLRGWHVQQLRQIAFTETMDEDAIVDVDSDVVFVRPFDARSFWRGAALRFFREPDAFKPDMDEHRAWSKRAGKVLGIPSPEITETDYITTLIGWRRDTAIGMLRRIEAVTGRSWVAALAASRALSECMIYGRFADELENRPDRHFASAERLCHIYWTGAAMTEKTLADFLSAMTPEQVAIGIQSFTGTDPMLIRRAAGLA
ncbi:DUF6492 family protein [Consotaella aegiceratis]|uniref:DUF6492 family protein n=1 Tax=Consotaella aegiceratis TaxID=3097961 RepID=UPI002F405C6A